jgi:nitric oxide reductase activation protein
VHATEDGEELELDRVIESFVDRRAGFSPDARLYRRRQPGTRDVAAAFLLDMSASTDIVLKPPAMARDPAEPTDPGLYLYSGFDAQPNPPAEPARCVLDVEKEAMALMGHALQVLGDSFAIFGFSGEGRHDVEFHVAKGFKERVSARTWAALAAMRPRRSTRMGAAIRHAVHKLSSETAQRKVLIIISDGYPEDSDYGPDRNSHEYGIMDTAQALRECSRQGIVDFCVTVDPSGHDYLKRMCAPSRYLVIDDVAALPRELTKIYKTLMV